MISGKKLHWVEYVCDVGAWQQVRFIISWVYIRKSSKSRLKFYKFFVRFLEIVSIDSWNERQLDRKFFLSVKLLSFPWICSLCLLPSSCLAYNLFHSSQSLTVRHSLLVCPPSIATKQFMLKCGTRTEKTVFDGIWKDAQLRHYIKLNVPISQQVPELILIF